MEAIFEAVLAGDPALITPAGVIDRIQSPALRRAIAADA